MGTSGLVPKIKDGDWVSVRQAIQKLSTKLGPVSTPVFSGIQVDTVGNVVHPNTIVFSDQGVFNNLNITGTIHLGLSHQKLNYIRVFGSDADAHFGVDSYDNLFLQPSDGSDIVLYTGESGDNIIRVRVDTVGKVGIGIDPKTLLTIEGAITLKEQAAADNDTAAYGQIWCKTVTPNQLWFTDDAGTDLRIAPQDLRVVASPQFLIVTVTNKFKLGGGAYIEYDSESSNIPLKLQDAAGASQVQIKDSNNATVAYIDSNGGIYSNAFSAEPNAVVFLDSNGLLDADDEILAVDRTNIRLGINKYNPAVTLDVVGAITASGIITGNSIITAGNIGIVADADLLQLAANFLTLNGKLLLSTPQDGNAVGFDLDLDNIFDGPAPIFPYSRGLDFNSRWLPGDGATGNKICSNLDGCYGQALLNTTNVTSGHNFTVTLATGVRAFVAASKGGSHTGNAVITKGCAFYVDDGSATGGAVITTQYGLYVSSLTAGASNYAIYTNAGPVRFGDNVEIADGKDIVFDTTTGTKIGTSATQKLAFFNTTPIIQNQLATGVGKTIDEVITELQRLGLVRQAA